MEITKESKIGTIAAHDYRTSSVFERYNINFCNQGNLKIYEVCADQKISPETLIKELRVAMSSRDEMYSNFNYWPIDMLADYIEKQHHTFFIRNAPIVLNELYIAADLFGDYYPSLTKIYKLFYKVTSDLMPRMKKEEELLFPYIREMANSRKDNKPIENARDFSLERILNALTREDENKVYSASQLFNITDDIENKVLFRSLHGHLKEFEDDLRLHAHLENNILLPKAMEMENTVER
ncbi:MAG: DUF542 domain-containing protein [Bacteroidia bacterium]|nr:DUF542 domain-containing protein [Bacteroidia bacterium]